MAIKFEGKFQVSGRITKIGEEQTFSSGFTKRDIIVEASKNEQYPSPVKVTLKKDDCAKADTLNVGDGVSVEGYVEGRKWDGPKGEAFFVDLTVKSLMVTDKAAPAAKPTEAKNWKELLALGKAYGEDEEAVKGRCKLLGKSFKDMQEADWIGIGKQIIEAHGGSASATDAGSGDGCEDEMPF